MLASGCSIFSLLSGFVVSSFCLFAQPAPPRQAMLFSHFLPWPRHMNHDAVTAQMTPLSMQYQTTSGTVYVSNKTAKLFN